MDATAFSIYDENYGLAEHEEAVRYMALERRVHRRMLGEGILDAIEKGKNEPRFGRAIMPGPTDRERKTGYVFLMLAYPENIELEGGYEQYRVARAEMLRAYCMGHYKNNQHVDRIIGIAMEPPPEVTGREGMSEDLALFEPEEWTEEIEREADELCKKYDVLKKGRVQKSRIQGNEYPDLPDNSIVMYGGDDDRMIIMRETDEDRLLNQPTMMPRHLPARRCHEMPNRQIHVLCSGRTLLYQH